MSPQWQARLIAADRDPAGRTVNAPRLRRRFTLDAGHGPVTGAVLHVTGLGLVEAHLNGRLVGDDVLAPGWSSYEWRLRYRSHDVTDLLDTTPGSPSVLGLALADGWAAGRLTWTGGRAFYADEPAAFAQLEVAFADGHVQVVATGADWSSAASEVLADDLYDGQRTDLRRVDPLWASAVDRAVDSGTGGGDGWGGVRELPFDTARLVPRLAPPVRRQEVLAPVAVLTSPSGKTLLDFGQNVVGWLRLRVQGPAGTEVVVRHAEVLEDGELGVRPLRSAQATDTFVLSGGEDVCEPTRTFHGFRYAEVSGWPGGVTREAATAGIEAVVVHSDLRRTGEFACSDELLNQLHSNVVWGLKGNFLDVPTDCPQRDERLGWTGDLAVFAPTAAYLFDTSDMLRDWLADLAAEQAAADGKVPFVVPDVLKHVPHPAEFGAPETAAVWSDAAVWVPWALWRAHGDLAVLRDQFSSMSAHVDRVEGLLSETGLWDTGFQFGDWLDPQAPPERPFEARADNGVVATACAFRSARITAEVAALLGRDGDAARYAELAERVGAAFRRHYVVVGDVTGDVGDLGAGFTIHSDCPTVYALAIEFGLLDGDLRQRAGDRLATLVRRGGHRIATGFAGTPFVTDALTATGHLDDAYRLLLQRECPSWLYPVTMGATTVWERWDSMLPDGSINPGEMTSFNHYALGAVADWMHRTVGGIAPLEPGYRRALLAPRPGGGLTWARAALDTPHGRLAVRWELDGDGALVVDAEVPAGTTALLSLPGEADRELPPGRHRVATARTP